MGDYEPGSASIVGLGDVYTAAGAPEAPLGMVFDAARAAVADAGIGHRQLDCVLTGRAPWADRRPQWNNIVASHLGLPYRHGTEVTTHGAGTLTMVKHAALAVTAGLADYALCVMADNARNSTDAVALTASLDADPSYELPYGPFVPAIHAQWASRYCHEFDVSDEARALVAVQHQDWAIEHPYAGKRDKGPIDVERVLQSPMVAHPLRLWECAQWGPGGTGAAFVVTRSDRARDLPSEAISIMGFGEYATHEYLSERMSLRSGDPLLGSLPNLTTTGAAVAGRAAFDMAGWVPSDVDLLQVGVPFTHYILMALEDLGFAARGEAQALVRDGRTAIGGDLPLNTNGGWLSFGQPGMSCVTDSLVEAVRQLRGCPLGREVPDPHNALVYSLGGMAATHSVLLLSKGT